MPGILPSQAVLETEGISSWLFQFQSLTFTACNLNYDLYLQGSRGDQGTPGTQGPPGEQGSQGEKGSPGPQGERVCNPSSVVLLSEKSVHCTIVQHLTIAPYKCCFKKCLCIDLFTQGRNKNVIADSLFYVFMLQGHPGVDKRGEKGEPGPKGIKGEKGKPGGIAGQIGKNESVITIQVRELFYC